MGRKSQVKRPGRPAETSGGATGRSYLYRPMSPPHKSIQVFPFTPRRARLTLMGKCARAEIQTYRTTISPEIHFKT